MDTHERTRDRAEEYALGDLPPEDERRIAEHLAGCADCRRYVADQRAVAAALARATPPLAAPPELRASLLAAATRHPTPVVSRRRWGTWALGAAAAAVIAGLGVETAVTRRDLAATRGQLASTRAVAAAIAAGRPVVRLEPTSGAGPAAVWVRPASGPALLYGPDLAPLPADKTYELWFLVGDAALPAGTFLAGEVIAPPSPPPGTTALAVTVEPRGGSAKPTTSPILVGKV